jgi:hypothetical protein
MVRNPIFADVHGILPPAEGDYVLSKADFLKSRLKIIQSASPTQGLGVLLLTNTLFKAIGVNIAHHLELGDGYGQNSIVQEVEMLYKMFITMKESREVRMFLYILNFHLTHFAPSF